MMDEDIDIEEHDLLDNPVLKAIFPDISVVKKEIECYYNAGTPNTAVDTQSSSTGSQDPTVDSTTLISEKSKSLDSIQESEDSTEIKEEHTFDTVKPDYFEKYKNMVIFGSKPNQAVKQQQLLQYQTRVLLNNVYPDLKCSDRYCCQCLILFPNKTAFDSHRDLVHKKACLNKNAFIKSKDLSSCDICSKEYDFSNLQCHLRHVHELKGNKEAKEMKTWNSHTEKSSANIKIGMRINLENESSKSANVPEDIEKRMCIDLKKQTNETGIKRNIKTKTCKTNSRATRNANNFDSASVKDAETETRGIYTCFHCDISFVTQKALIEHLYNVMQLKKMNSGMYEKTIPDQTSLKIDTSTKKEKRPVNSLYKGMNGNGAKSKNAIKTSNAKQIINNKVKKLNLFKKFNSKHEIDQQMFYKCDVCSFYFKTTELCSRHLMMKHGVIKKEFKKEPFVSNCVFCLKKMAKIDDYNIHIFTVHKKKYTEKLFAAAQISGSEQETNNESRCVSFVLKSILFKCIQCDIHFLSAKAAQHHAEHMELLINWKCDKCHRIFKKNDEHLHENQHKFSNEFVVYDLSKSALSRVLYTCSKCTIHFAEEQFLSHYPICGAETPVATYCKVCDILIDDSTIKSHEMMHSEGDSLYFISIETDIISINSESTCVQKRKSIVESDTIAKKKKQEMYDVYDLFHCETCDCFVYEQHVIIHMKAQCVKFGKNICKICGLVFSNRCYLVHKDLHTKLKSLKVHDFTFRKLKTKEIINPPIPEYLGCNICKVIFISKTALLSHECSDEDYLTCHICENKISDDAFKLHMSFHNYSIANIQKDDRPEIGSSINEKPLISSPALKEQTICPMDLPGTSDLPQNTSDMKSLQALPSYSAPTKIDPRIFNETNSRLSKSTNIDCKFNQKEASTRRTVEDCSVDSYVPELNASSSKSVQSGCGTTMEILRQKSNAELDPLIYSCKNCGITVDTYDKVIEHCQKHYEGIEMEINTEDSFCLKCNLKFDKSCYESHEKLHQEKSYFKLLRFDTYYFSSENDIWIKHVFGSMPQSLIDSIVNGSIYRWECRVKMRIVQDGPPYLTVFKCDKCQCFIDKFALYKHADNSCFKMRYHLCTFCGIPLISSVARFEHEKIHETANVTVKSYRIVIFNRKFTGNDLYTLYLCRNCDGVMDKSQIMNHTCDIPNLKKCLVCGLLLCGADIETHILRHKNISNFTPKNMKIIIFGHKIEGTKDYEHRIKPSYCGTMYDYYTYYRCSICKVCLREKFVPDHVCSFGVSTSQCSQCDLSFLSNKYIYHRTLHDDPDYKPEYVRVIAFDPRLRKNYTSKFPEPVQHAYISRSPKNVISSDGVTLKVAKIYKCTCGLHFLDAISVSVHIKCCNPRIRKTKQKCSKCDLLFTSNILFRHLLTHHGDKKHKYKFEIIDLTCKSDLTNILYRCPTCKLHFVNGKEASAHLRHCKGDNFEGKQCNYCNLLLNEACFDIHIENSCTNRQGRGNQIYEIKNCSIPLVKIDEH